jgi:hypothetical protein
MAKPSGEIVDEPGWHSEHVQPFVSNNLPPLSTQINSEFAWTPNGSDPKAQGPSAFAEKGKQTNEIVGEPGWHSEHVQPFVDHNLPPLSSQINSEFAWAPNGSNPKA